MKNTTYFDNIITENQAYILGFIYGDGCVYTRKRNNGSREYSLSFNLSDKDKDILVFIRDQISPETVLKYKKESKMPTGYIRKPQCSLTIYSKTLIESLNNFGLFNRKTYLDLNIPNIDKKLIRHFIRGYFDADGCISNTFYNSAYVNRHGDKIIYKCYTNTVNIVSKTSCLLEQIELHLYETLGIISKIRKDSVRNVYILNLKAEYKMLFLDYLYMKANVYLKRKYEKYLEFKKTSSEFRELKNSGPCNA